MMKKYCLGYTHDKCDICLHEKNWQALNEMPDAERLPLQATMVRIDSDKCRLTSMGEYAAAKRPLDDIHTVAPIHPRARCAP